MVYRDWGSLEKDIISKVQSCAKEAQDASLYRLSEYLDRFYNTPEPKQYIRTGHLGSSASADFFTTTHNGGYGNIYMDESIDYETGTYDTPTVFMESEIHGSKIKGNPWFWRDTMDDIENIIIPSVFGRYFK